MRKRNEAFILGVLIGAAVSVMCAPQSGKELRKKISKKTDAAKEKGQDLKQTTMSASSDHWQNLTENIGKVTSKVKETTHDYGELTKEKGQELKETIQSASSDHMDNNIKNAKKVIGKVKETFSPSSMEDKMTSSMTSSKKKTEPQDKQEPDFGPVAHHDAVPGGVGESAERSYSTESLDEGTEERTMEFSYDQEKADDDNSRQTANVSTEQTKEDADRDDRKTTNTNVGI